MYARKDSIEGKEKLKLSRYSEIDLLRILCAVVIIGIHVNALYVTNMETYGTFTWWMSNIIYICGRFATPIFFMISGYLTLNSKKNLNIKTFYTSKFKKVVIPFAIWTCIYILYDQINYNNSIDMILFVKRFVVGILGSEQYYHLWFFYSLIIMYLITPILIKVLDNLSDKDMMLIIIFFIMQNSIINTIGTILDYKSQWNIPLGDFGLVYYLIGGYIGKVGVSYINKYKKKIYLTSIISLIVSILINYIYTGISGNMSETLGSRSFFTAAITSLAIFIFVFNIDFDRVGFKVKNNIRNIAKYGLGVYLIHPIIIEYTQRIILYKNVFSMTIEFIISVIISYISVYIIKKLPIVRNILP